MKRTHESSTVVHGTSNLLSSLVRGLTLDPGHGTKLTVYLKNEIDCKLDQTVRIKVMLEDNTIFDSNVGPGSHAHDEIAHDLKPGYPQEIAVCYAVSDGEMANITVRLVCEQENQ